MAWEIPDILQKEGLLTTWGSDRQDGACCMKRPIMPGLGYQEPVIYCIRVKGTLDPSWSHWFDGMRVEVTSRGETVLTGAVRDQSALHGLLGKIRDMGLPLILVKQIDR
jgi:hypothetical protein